MLPQQPPTRRRAAVDKSSTYCDTSPMTQTASIQGTATYTLTDQDARLVTAIAGLRDYTTARCDISCNGKYAASARIHGVDGDRIKVEVTRVNPGTKSTVVVGDMLAVPARLITAWTC